MAEITITTDGTIENTKLIVDGKDLTKKTKVVSIDLYASAPFKGQYSGEIYNGGVSVSYSHVDDEGKIKRESYGKTETNYTNGVGQKTVKNEDSVISFVGKPISNEVSTLVDEILDHCESNNVKCPSRDILATRSKESLTDKAEDLGIHLEDEDKYYAVKASETEGNEPKYPINNCSDVEDAWKLRSHGKGLKISQKTLEQRIKRRAKSLGCDIPGENNDSTLEDATGSTTETNGHEHSYSVDGKGNGSTNKVDGHKHEINDWKLQTKNDHKHKVQVQNKKRRGAVED